MISENVITRAILDTSFTVHSDLGPGLLESVYERILEAELIDKGFDVRRQCRYQSSTKIWNLMKLFAPI